MADISKITLPSGTTYDIKDAVARAAVAGGVSYIGVSTTAITDGGSEKPTINGSQQTPINGNLVIYGSGEFIFTGDYGSGGTWSEFGDMSNLGDFAYVDHGYTQAFTPSGTVTQPTFTGTGVRLVTGNISVPASASFSGDSLTSTGEFTPAGTISATQIDTPAQGSPTFQANGSILFSRSGASTTSNEYTPEGTVSAPTISIDAGGSTTTIKNPTAVTVAKTVVTQEPSSSSHPSNPLSYASVSNETLILNQIGYTTGDSITTSNVTVKNGDASYTASAPAFTGTKRSVSFNGKYYVVSFTGTEDDVEVTGTPSGSISFTNTNKTATVSATSGTATYTPSGTVSQPTFSGSQIIDVQVDTNQHSL